ncbi:hypothetical protein BZG01_03815 [Labilibaculum manganireducens]|uniref:PepSY domain-containing protein n=1 Tax=Labilibaculum manganireducens TaxID=1940525 RepID=A0A2N3IDA9_9BACT|nr:PepSY domain-containing protein [Labilibaculum manganireducens]PKQ68354.1 hypothetical protein BZG01_03815 [Labilibaculum manganireducens]
MSRFKNITLQIHNLSGSVLSLMFVIWFLSGFVLIFAGFPHASKEERFLHLSFLTKSDFDSIQAPSKSFSGEIELEKMNGNPVYRVYSGRKSQKVYNAVSLNESEKATEKEAVNLAEDFTGAKLQSVEKIEELDQWIPWDYYNPLLPIYKCYLNDKDHTRIYISEKTGSIIQETTRKSRWAARLGAIPHWIYFKSLRLQKGLWLKVVAWISFLGILVSITGLVAGFIRLKKRKKNSQWTEFSPYKKFWYKWHHITGFLFGFFVFTFILSGFFSVVDIPKSLVPVHAKVSAAKVWNQKPDAKQHAVISMSDLWNAVKGEKPIRKVVWKTVMNQACFWVYRDQFELPDVYVATADGVFAKPDYSEKEISSWCKSAFTGTNYDLKELNEFDAYYQKSGMWKRPLPVWQLSLHDADHTCMYIHPKTGEVIKSYNSNDRGRRWLYKSLHTLDFPFLKQHEWLRKFLLLFLSLGGTVVSVSGFVLGIKWIRRKAKKSLPVRLKPVKIKSND